MLVCNSFTLASLADCNGSEEISKQKALEIGDKNVDEALIMLREVGNALNSNTLHVDLIFCAVIGQSDNEVMLSMCWLLSL